MSCEDNDAFNRMLRGTFVYDEPPMQLTTYDHDGSKVFQLHLFFVDLMAPMDCRPVTLGSELKEPAYRVYNV